MALILTFPAHPEACISLKILVAAAHAGVECTLNHNITWGVEQQKPEFLRNCSPLGALPVLQTPDGYLFESGAILRHIGRLDKSNTFIYGRTPFEASQCDMWIDWTQEITQPVSPFYHTMFGAAAPTNVAELQKNLDQALAGLEQWLETRTFLVGERLTIADVAIAFALQMVFRFAPEAEALSKKFKGCFRLYNTVMQQPKTVEVLKAHGATFGLIPKAKEEKKKEEKKPAEKKPKEEKPKEEAADDAEEEEVHEEKKKPNPLDALPPSKFVLDTWKREYSNTDTRTAAAPYLLANFDAEGFSAFWCRYKYNADLKMQFMSANLCRGWFQRMEGVRKYAFGIALILGEESKHEIQGFWIFRGKGMPECVREVEDTELFDWQQIPDIKAEMPHITDFLCWEGPTLGAPVMEGRAFK